MKDEKTKKKRSAKTSKRGQSRKNLGKSPEGRGLLEKVKHELNSARAILHSALDGVQDHVMVIDRDFKVILLNRAAREFYGERAGGEGPLYCYQLSHGKAGPCFRYEDLVCPHNEVLASGHAVATVHRHCRGDGDLRFVEITAVPLRDEGSGAVGTIKFIKDITERRVVEEAFVDSESRFRKLFEHATIGMVLVDAEGRIIDANPAFSKMLGYSEKELVGMGISGLVHPGDAAKDKAPLKELVEGKLGYCRTEKRYIRKDGRVIWGRLSASKLKVRSGDPKLAMGLMEDITERRKAEEAIMEAKARAEDERAKTEAVLEAMGDAISIQDMDFKVLYQNKAHRDRMGDKVGQYCFKAYHGNDAVCEGCHLAMSLKDGKVHTRETTATLDKGIVYSEITASPLRDSSGEIIAGIEVVRDITERKRMEEALRAREAQLQTLLEAIPDSVMLKDTRGRHILINRACAETFGIRGEDVLGKTAEEFLPPDLAEYCLRSDAEALKAGKPLVFEERSHGKEGGEAVFETLKAPVYDDRGNPLGLVAVSRDITGRKRMENALRQSLAEKDMLIKEVHHRVKNNLSVISSLLRLQTKELEDEKTKNILIESRNRVSSMSLIHEKLYRAKDVKRINFKEYIRELTVHLFRTYEVGARVQLSIDIPDIVLDIDTVIPCGLIVNELVSNALKYAFPKGRGGELSIRFHLGEEGWHTLEVKDNGVGFPKGVDFREAGSLGMQIVTSLASQLEGTVDMERDGGTAFRIRLKDRGLGKE